MTDTIVSITTQTENPPIFDDYKLIVGVGYKTLTIHLFKKDTIRACETAIVLSLVLELVDDNIVKFGTHSGDGICKEFMASYRRKKEKRQPLLPVTTALQKIMIKYHNYYITP